MIRLSRFRVVSLLAWRNLFSNKGKNAIVGLIMCFGTFLVVLGTSLLDSIERSMTRSVTASIAGHFQVYDQDANDDLALFGGGFMGAEDIGSIPDFHRVKQELLKVPNVKAVVPMGMDTAEYYLASDLDRAIESLRQAIKSDDRARVLDLSKKIRSMAELMKAEFENRKKILLNREEIERSLRDIELVMTEAFWSKLEIEPQQLVMFLDTQLAPLVDENEMMFMRYLGTDLHLFAENFETFEILEGRMVPRGARGLLVNKNFYDNAVRNRVARELDDLHREVFEKKKKIAQDPLLQNQVERMVRQYRRITFQLEPSQADRLSVKLTKLMPEAQGNIEELIQSFLEVNDDNIEERHRFFFEVIAPEIKLYLFEVGDVITIRTYTKSGYIKSVNIKVYGTFRFKGLERSALAGSHNLLDMLTFRDLYGMMTAEKLEELQGIRKQVGLEDIPADEAEESLFGGQGEIETIRDEKHIFDEFADVNLKRNRKNGKAYQQGLFDQEDIDRGLALHAAVVLEDPDRMEDARQALQKTIQDKQLGLKLVGWQAASGIVGQLVVLVRVVLYVATFIIFLVALVIINNTMIMATMERTTEIGTIRAMGGQAGLVMMLFLLETLILSAVAGALGTLLGAGLVNYLGQEGIPAVHDFLVFLFSGPRLYPTVGANNLMLAWIAVLVVCLAATFYPAFLATRIQPVVAMQGRE